VNGILVIDKPQGWTSHDVVNFVRRKFGINKAGHAGTLDPMATGVLVVLLGRYTKFSGELMDGLKEYKTVLTLGKATDTQDATGRTLNMQPVPRLDIEDIRTALKRFIGEIEQVPPMVSAIKVKGQRLYKLARQGKEIQRQPRKVKIDKLQLEAFNPPDISMTVVCNKGTYIRTLCEDIARTLDCPGHMSYLRRTSSGRYSLKDAVAIDRLKEISGEDLKDFIVER
jgi:tRNA pseudouridine55 synthase